MKGGYISRLCDIWPLKCCFALVFFFVLISPITVLSETKNRIVDGLYVEVFPYDELSDFYNQKLRLAEGKRAKIYIDFSSYETFIPLNDSLLIEIPESRFRLRKANEATIKIPRQHDKNLCESAGFTTDHYAENEVIAQSSINIATLYESKSGKYIYRIVFMRVEVENSDADDVIKSANFSLNKDDELWIVKRIISYDPYINIPWLKKWAPFKQYKRK